MGTTPDGPAAHILVATWANGGFGQKTSSQVCEPEVVPPPLAAPIPVTGESFIIPVTGTDHLAVALAARQELFLVVSSALLGISMILGGTKKKKK